MPYKYRRCSPRRPRCAYTGEIDSDGCILHPCLCEKSQLHIGVDDATGAIVGAYFDSQETLKGYYHVLNHILTDYGIPYMLFTDRRTVFEYKKKNTTAAEEDTFTQFSYACKQLGIEIKTSSVPQAKGVWKECSKPFNHAPNRITAGRGNNN